LIRRAPVRIRHQFTITEKLSPGQNPGESTRAPENPCRTGSRNRRRTAANEGDTGFQRSEEHTSELQSLTNLVCRLLLEKKKKKLIQTYHWHIQDARRHSTR